MKRETLINETLIAKLLKGSAIAIESLFLVKPLTVGEIIDYGVEEYFVASRFLCLNKQDIITIHKEEEIKVVPEVYDYICASMYESTEFSEKFRRAFRLFTNETLTVLIVNNEFTMLVGALEDKRVLDKDTFYWFQNIIRMQNAMPLEFEITDAQAEKRARFDALRKERDRVKREQGGEEESGFADMVSSLAVLSKQPLEQIYKLTYYALLEQFTRHMRMDNYNWSHQSILHGADAKKIEMIDYTGAIRPYEQAQ